MKVLVVGSGGREHTIAWKVQQSDRVAQVFVAPGNAGTQRDPTLSNVTLANDDAIASFCRDEAIDLVIIGPEAPLVAGLGDRLRGDGVAVVGPNADGARLEASKAYCKDVLVCAGVPTAAYAQVSSHSEIDAFVDGFEGTALVVKADGLAAGKGVIVCDDVETARTEAHAMLDEQPFGEASATIVLEERLEGIETSFIVLTDGTRYVSFPTSQDHKRLLDGDEGPNTGGMGAFSPAPFVSDALVRDIERDIIEPTLAELRKRSIDFRGFLYAGIMLTPQGPSVLEYNVRLGDPETQVLLTAIEGDIVPHLVACAAGSLTQTTFGSTQAAAVVVLAAEGYPQAPVKGATIEGLEAAATHDNVVVFHAGTKASADACTVAGGRVLGVTAVGPTPDQAVARAYAAADDIAWAGMQRREDIGKALKL